ncbi:MAG TPA: ABC transporter permease [Fimbriiglobus sp.]|nr:ABC transporter permease [Fimbriiglobus sp.]
MFAHLKAVWTFRYFWMSLVRMDLRSRYRRSVLGIGWSVLHPLAMSAVFCLVFAEIMKVQGGDPAGYPAQWRWYAAYLLCGMSVWSFIQTSTAIGCQALLMNEAYIRQCPLPYGIYPLRTVMGTGIHFVISMAVVVALVCVMKGTPAPLGLLWAVIPVLVLLFLFCWALATLAAFATVYFHDTAHLVEVGSQLFFFLTPIMYPRTILEAKGAKALVDLNPVVVFLELIRTPLVDGTLPAAQVYVQGVVLTLAAVGLAFGTIGWLQKKVIFHM